MFTRRVLTAASRSSAQATRSFSTAPKTTFDPFWMPFTDNHEFKADPRKVFERAEGSYYYLEDGTPILDGVSGLWCCNAGHSPPKISKAIADAAGKLDFAPCFNTGHKAPAIFAQKILDLLPNRGFEQVFFTMCGSTAVDSALKIALQYHRANGEGTRVKFIGRERGYHGVGFGGISVGGMTPNRKAFSGNLLPNIDHIKHTYSHKNMAFSRGQPEWGAERAEELEELIALHDASTIAAVIIEPVAGSTGVLPPPVGYLERLRAICDKHGVLLIFDEVITGFGRLGETFATTRFNVTPDMICCAKGMTNAAVPCGGVIAQGFLYEGINKAAHKNPGHQIELFHGYTYSGHPLAMAAGIAAMEVMEEADLCANVRSLEGYFEEQLHSLKGLPHVVDIRNMGFMGAVELATVPGLPVARSMDVFNRAFDRNVLLRAAGPNVVCAPPLISKKEHIDEMIGALREAIVESGEKLKV